MSAFQKLQILATELIQLENTFDANGEPPNEKAATEWLHLMSDFREAHGLRRGSRGPNRRNSLRLPTSATVQCLIGSDVVEARCTVLGRGGLGLSINRIGITVGTKLEILRVDH